MGQKPHNAGQFQTCEANEAIIDSTDITPFNAPMTKGRPKVIKTREELDVAGRYFVYKLYETTDGQPMQWQLLGV